MPAINEAYRVLSDPARRAVYDAGLRTRASRAGAGGGDTEPATATGWTDGAEAATHTSTSGPMHPSHVGPARFPWRGVLVLAVVGIIGVVVLAQFTEPGTPRGPDGVVRVGDCVEVLPDTAVSEVACIGDPTVDLVVEAFVPFDGRCPGGSTPYRDRQGMGIACIGDSVSVGDDLSSSGGDERTAVSRRTAG